MTCGHQMVPKCYAVTGSCGSWGLHSQQSIAKLKSPAWRILPPAVRRERRLAGAHRHGAHPWVAWSAFLPAAQEQGAIALTLRHQQFARLAGWCAAPTSPSCSRRCPSTGRGRRSPPPPRWRTFGGSGPLRLSYLIARIHSEPERSHGPRSAVDPRSVRQARMVLPRAGDPVATADRSVGLVTTAPGRYAIKSTHRLWSSSTTPLNEAIASVRQSAAVLA